MDTLKDFLTFLRMWQRVKQAPVLSVGWSTRLLRNRNPRRRLPIPPYQRGPMGGYLVPFRVEEPKRGLEWIVWIEMYAPTLRKPYWLPVEHELTLIQVAAMMKMSPSRLYGRLRTHPMKSAVKRGSKWVFRTEDFLRYDLPDLDPNCDREPSPDEADKPTPGFRARPNDRTYLSATWTPRDRRAGPHRAGCDKNHLGPCTVPPRAKQPRQPRSRTPHKAPRWTADLRTKAPRNPHGAKARTDAATPTSKQEAYRQCLPERPTTVELRLWRMAGGNPERYLSLAEEYSDEISEARARGLFAPKPKKR